MRQYLETLSQFIYSQRQVDLEIIRNYLYLFPPEDKFSIHDVNPAINFDWGNGSPDATIPADNFSTRWTKTEVFSAGDYEFSVTADDGVRLYIDNNLVIDKWFDQGPITYTTAQFLSSGDHTIKMEYYESGGGAVAKFYSKQLNTSPIYLNQGTTSNSGTAYTYDANGNMTSDGTTSEMKIEDGIVRVHENKVTVYLGIMG